MIAHSDHRGGGPSRPRTVVLSPRAGRDLARLPADRRQTIAVALRRYAEEGYGDVRRLTDVHPPAYRLRVGDFRVLFALAPDRVEVERVVNRRDAY